MTRVFPIALVNTPGVLEVLVTIVPVGEHLPAPLTREALTGWTTKGTREKVTGKALLDNKGDKRESYRLSSHWTTKGTREKVTGKALLDNKGDKREGYR